MQHPAQADNVDVVAINIGSYVQPQDFITFLSTENFLPSNMILSLGDTVLVLGYPMSFYDTSHNLPIAKTGTMASPYGVPFEGRSYFLIDANLQPGTSGSPVLSPAGSLRRMTDGTNMAIGVDAANHLLGIHSAEHIMEGVELGLHVVWYAGLIQEIVSQEHPRVVQDNNPPQQ